MRRLFPALFTPVILTGCVLTAEHLVPRSEAILDPRLPGTWTDSNGDRVTILQDREQDYRVFFRRGDNPDSLMILIGRLGRIGGFTILEVWPDPDLADDTGPYAGLLAPGHLHYVVEIDSNRIRMGAIDPDTARQALRDGRLQLRPAEGDSEEPLWLFGSPDELRRDLMKLLPGVVMTSDGWSRGATTPSDTSRLSVTKG